MTTVNELIRQCGNPEYTIQLESLYSPFGFRLEITFSSDELAAGGYRYRGGDVRLLIAQLVRIRNQDGAVIDRVDISASEVLRACKRGAIDKRVGETDVLGTLHDLGIE